MFRPTAMSRRARIIAVVVSAAVLLVGAALLTQDRGGSAPFGIGGTDTEKSIEATGPTPAGSVIGTSAVVGKDRTQQSLATTMQPSMAVAPAADGADLTTITTPPDKTLSMLAKDAATADSKYRVTIGIYGFGPRMSGIHTVVALVSESAPEGKPAKPYEFKGRNVLLRLDPNTAQDITGGGAYTGVITLRLSGDTLIPWLSDVGHAE